MSSDFKWYELNPLKMRTRFCGYLFGSESNDGKAQPLWRTYRGLVIQYCLLELHGKVHNKEMYPMARIKYTAPSENIGRCFWYKNSCDYIPRDIVESKVDPLVLKYVTSGQWLIQTEEIEIKRSKPSRYINLNTGEISTLITRKRLRTS